MRRRHARVADFDHANATDRLFLAVLPGAAAAARAHAIAEALKAGSGSQAQPVPASRLHVTLHYFGEFAGVPDALVGAVDEAMRGIGLRVFDACLDRAWSFEGGPHRKPWVLGTSAEQGMQALHAGTGRRLAAAGVRAKHGAGFVPHMTVLYGREALAPRQVDPVRLEIREVTLVASLVGRGEHRVLRRWPLNGIA